MLKIKPPPERRTISPPPPKIGPDGTESFTKNRILTGINSDHSNAGLSSDGNLPKVQTVHFHHHIHLLIWERSVGGHSREVEWEVESGGGKFTFAIGVAETKIPGISPRWTGLPYWFNSRHMPPFVWIVVTFSNFLFVCFVWLSTL